MRLAPEANLTFCKNSKHAYYTNGDSILRSKCISISAPSPPFNLNYLNMLNTNKFYLPFSTRPSVSMLPKATLYLPQKRRQRFPAKTSLPTSSAICFFRDSLNSLVYSFIERVFPGVGCSCGPSISSKSSEYARSTALPRLRPG